MRGVLLLSVLALGACARGGSASSDDDSGPGIDAPPGDGPIEPDPDGPPPDTGMQCVPQVTQILVNATVDAMPRAMGWIEQLIRSNYPIITTQDDPGYPPEHTAPYKIWLGGFAGNNVTDVLHQDVAIPPNTSKLVLTGVHDVRTRESSSANMMYDTASASLTATDGTPIVTILALSNLTPKTGWTPFEHTFTQDLSGQTVRLRMTSRNDSSYPTDFLFDTLALTATHGCP